MLKQIAPPIGAVTAMMKFKFWALNQMPEQEKAAPKSGQFFGGCGVVTSSDFAPRL
jgi:hypothetical protein